jgi:nucleotide-binding universal stress UspA family protein
MMKILIGHDGSPAAGAIFADLGKSGLPERAEALVLSACPPFLPLEALAPSGIMPPGYERAYAEACANHEAIVKTSLARAQGAARKLKAVFPKWTIAAEAVTDTPAHALLDRAGAWKADLIVLASRGWSEFGKLILGSVADRVLNHAGCPVRISRLRKGARGGSPNLLIAFDGSKHAEAVVAAVAARTWPKGTRATILAVSEFQLRMGDISLALTKALGRSGESSPWPWMEGRLAKAARKLADSGLAADTALIIGEPRPAILAQAKRLKADCIFLGSHGYTGLRRVMLGSVSATVSAHAPCSVEVIHRYQRPEIPRKRMGTG